jgi:outer membrane protein assembly factor BamB
MRMRGTFGEGATPALHGDRIIVPWDHEGESFIVALDKKTGDQKWRVEREERSNWSMPIVVEVKGRKQVIHPGASASIAYDFETGDEIWRCKGMTDNVIPTPIIGHGMVYLISGFRRGALQAVQLDQAEGDITDSAAVAWSLDKGTPYIPSGLLSGGRLYFLEGSRAMLSCHDAKTGEAHYSRERLDLGGMYSSPVAAAGKIFLCDREGGVAVLKDGPELEVIATNDLGEPICATPAIVGGQIFVRGSDHLWCIGK